MTKLSLGLWTLLVARVAAAEAQSSAEYGARATVQQETQGESVSASDVRIKVSALARVPRRDAQSLLTLAPGVLLTNHGGEGHTASMFLRGFDAGEGEDIEFTVAGMPFNELSNHHGHGYVDTTFLLPEVVTELRVVEGPFDPAQGDFAVAGSAEFSLGLREPGWTSSFALGKYRRRRLFLGFRPREERSRTFAAVGLERGDGFGVNRAFSQASALGQYDAKLAAGTYVKTLLFAGAQRWDSAGVIRDDDYRARSLPCSPERDAQFYCTYDPNQGGSGQRIGVTSELERRRPSGLLRVSAFLLVRGLRTRENFTGFSSDPAAAFGEPQRGDLRDGRTDAATLGGRATARRRVTLWGHEHQAEAGLFVRHDLVSTVMDRVRSTLDTPYLTDFNRKVRQTNLGLYGRADVHPWSRLRISAGVRADAFAFSVLDRNQPTTDRLGPRLGREATDAYGFAVSPRGTVDVTLLDDLHFLTSVGLGARSSDATALSQAESAPFARVTAAEMGLGYARWVGPVSLESRASLFVTRVSRDLVFDATSGRNQPTGPSHRLGGMGMVRAQLPAWADVLISAAYTEAHFPPRDGSLLRPLAGTRVPFVPAWLVRADAVLERASPRLGGARAFAALGVGSVGRRPLPYGTWARSYAVLDGSTGIHYRFAELSLSVTNLLDRRYRLAELSYVSNFAGPDSPQSQVPARHFAAGAPRQWLLTLAVHLDSFGDDP